jgi:ABC-2 type transport system permease protein
MYLAKSYFKIYFLNTVRYPSALFFTLIFPPLLLLMTSHQWGPARYERIESFIVFLNYSVQTIAFMLLGMGVSAEKNSEWAKYQRTLAAPLSAMILGRVMHTLGLCFINLITITLIGVFALSIPLTVPEIAYFFAMALLGAIPLALMGMTIGYAANAESSRSIFTLLNLLFLFGSFGLPSKGFFSYVKEAVPTYQWLKLSSKIVQPEISVIPPLICLGAYAVVFAFLFQKIYFKSQNY